MLSDRPAARDNQARRSQQADAGTSRKYGGTGLGLAISREARTASWRAEAQRLGQPGARGWPRYDASDLGRQWRARGTSAVPYVAPSALREGEES